MSRTTWIRLLPFLALASSSASLSAQTTVLFDAQETKLRAADPGANDLFGNSVDIDGNRAVVGAIFDDTASGGDSGSVYVYERTGTNWTQTAKIGASDADSSDYFGVSAAVDGDTIVVGAYADNTAAGVDAGSAYVYVLCGGVWVEQAHLFHPAGATSDYFGHQVAIDGNTIAVGAYQDDTCAADSGSAWIFVRNTHGTGDHCDDTWDLQTATGLSSGSCQASGGFGIRLDVQGNRLVVGAYLENSPAADQGAAYVFERTGSTWTMISQLIAGNGAAGDEFGVDVAIDGDTVFVGAAKDDSPESDRGSVHVFTRQGGLWFFQQQLLAADGAAGDMFGIGLTVQGDTAVIGAYLDDLSTASGAGSAYLYRSAGGNWVEDQKVNMPDFAANDEFGLLMALDGGTALISARRDDDSGGDTGSVAVVKISKGQFERFGFGDGTGTACPCGNDTAVGLEEGCANSLLHGGTLSVAGTDSASADNFRMIAWNLIPGNPALLFTGPNRLAGGAGLAFGNGLRMVGGFVVRRGIQAPNSDGRAVWGPGLDSVGAWPSGTAVHFQVWYRDPFHSSCVDVFNLTSGVTIRFKP